MEKDIHIQDIQMSVVKFILPTNINWELTPKNNDTIITFEEKYQNIICKYLYNNLDLTITKDNIHQYYEFMSDDDLEKYKQILNSIFTDRYSYLYDKIKIKLDMLEIKTLFGSFHVGLKLFKMKDTLKPIDKYIEEIKASNEYKEYIKNNQ